MNQEKRLEILKALQRTIRHRKRSSSTDSNFELLIALYCRLATDKSVNEATRVLFPLANTPQAVLDLGPEKIHRHHQTHRALPKQDEERDEAL